MKPVYVLGVRIDALGLNEAIQKARHFLSSDRVNLIFTPNPEMAVKAKTDELFRGVLNAGDLNICDGKGLQLVSSEKLERITGIDFMLELCALAEQNHKSIFLLGSGSDEVVKKTAEKLLERFPRLIIVGMDKGPEIMEQGARSKEQISCSRFHVPYSFGLKIDPSQNEDLIKKINTTKPDILFVAFGMGKQEKWLCENRDRIPTVRIGMGVGGAFDYISGKVKRAPCWMRKVGLEWLYRLVREPFRLPRIVNASVVFIYLSLINQLGMNKKIVLFFSHLFVFVNGVLFTVGFSSRSLNYEQFISTAKRLCNNEFLSFVSPVSNLFDWSLGLSFVCIPVWIISFVVLVVYGVTALLKK